MPRLEVLKHTKYLLLVNFPVPNRAGIILLKIKKAISWLMYALVHAKISEML